ncbi:hypothetical protein HK098_000640 [Nowakowskiella sp. JEL0407]|nr:hypothetical protein HK098_000640 [Nowakowskiella sp. JEL0407]
MSEILDSEYLLDVVGRLTLEAYVGNEITKTLPLRQQGATCYAHAVATVIHFVSKRIAGREVPKFTELRDIIIELGAFGMKGSPLEPVIKSACEIYRLRYRRITRVEAWKAAYQRRPVVTGFFLRQSQWDKFNRFFMDDKTKRSVIDITDVAFNRDEKNPLVTGHAAVLISADPRGYYYFMNSWGPEWGDNGYFRVKEMNVFNDHEFFEIYFEDQDLTDDEREMFKVKGLMTIQDLQTSNENYRRKLSEVEPQLTRQTEIIENQNKDMAELRNEINSLKAEIQVLTVEKKQTGVREETANESQLHDLMVELTALKNANSAFKDQLQGVTAERDQLLDKNAINNILYEDMKEECRTLTNLYSGITRYQLTNLDITKNLRIEVNTAVNFSSGHSPDRSYELFIEIMEIRTPFLHIAIRSASHNWYLGVDDKGKAVGIRTPYLFSLVISKDLQGDKFSGTVALESNIDREIALWDVLRARYIGIEGEAVFVKSEAVLEHERFYLRRILLPN